MQNKREDHTAAQAIYGNMCWSFHVSSTADSTPTTSPTPTRTSNIQEDVYLYMNTRHEHTANAWKPARWHKQASNQSYLHALMHIWAAAKHRQAQTIGWCRVLPNSECCPTRLLQQALETILRWFNNRLKPWGFLPITRRRAKELKKCLSSLYPKSFQA
jgi:hypothetical protein